MHITELIVSPAYGRDYMSADTAVRDWMANKDFVCHAMGTGGRYCNRADVDRLQDRFPVHTVKIRFKRMTDFVFVHRDSAGNWTKGGDSGE